MRKTIKTALEGLKNKFIFNLIKWKNFKNMNT
jgi:hypothetical protein